MYILLNIECVSSLVLIERCSVSLQSLDSVRSFHKIIPLLANHQTRGLYIHVYIIELLNIELIECCSVSLWWFEYGQCEIIFPR